MFLRMVRERADGAPHTEDGQTLPWVLRRGRERPTGLEKRAPILRSYLPREFFPSFGLGGVMGVRRRLKSAGATAHRRRVKFERQDGRCWWCGERMTLERGKAKVVPANFATFEHLVRRADGGAGMPDNVVLACRVCNNERHNRPRDVPVEGTGWALV